MREKAYAKGRIDLNIYRIMMTISRDAMQLRVLGISLHPPLSLPPHYPLKNKTKKTQPDSSTLKQKIARHDDYPEPQDKPERPTSTLTHTALQPPPK